MTLTTLLQQSETTRRDLKNLLELDLDLNYLAPTSGSMRRDNRVVDAVLSQGLANQRDIMHIIGFLG